MFKSLRQHWDIGLFLLTVAAFPLWAGIDLSISQWFYHSGEGFYLKDESWVQNIHHGIPRLATLVTALLLAVITLSWAPAFAPLSRHRPAAIYLLITLAIGPALLVNGVLKSHSGRARPADVAQFGGDKLFSPPLLVGDQCRHNCSFVSGHAAFGFAICALGFLTGRRHWFGVAVAVGGFWGLARMAQGKHFLSDVVFAFFVVYFSAKLLHFLMFHPDSPLTRRAAAPVPRLTLAERNSR